MEVEKVNEEIVKIWNVEFYKIINLFNCYEFIYNVEDLICFVD